MYSERRVYAALRVEDLEGRWARGLAALFAARQDGVAPLAPLVGLQELHASSQKLPAGIALDLAPAALAGMQQLRVLSVANNGLTSANELKSCQALQVC